MILAETYLELAPVLVGADHADVRTAERGVTCELASAALSWRPAWMNTLFRARTVLARGELVPLERVRLAWA
jgi:hypothetical protein